MKDESLMLGLPCLALVVPFEHQERLCIVQLNMLVEQLEDAILAPPSVGRELCEGPLGGNG